MMGKIGKKLEIKYYQNKFKLIIKKDGLKTLLYF